MTEEGLLCDGRHAGAKSEKANTGKKKKKEKKGTKEN